MERNHETAGEDPDMSCLVTLKQRIASKQAVVGVIGLGYVGLPLALVFEEAGFAVLGFDVDAKKPEALNRGEREASYSSHSLIANH